MTAAPAPDLSGHYRSVVTALCDDEVVPFLGSGVSHCGRPSGRAWTPSEVQFLPDGSELTGYLADHFHYPADEPQDLLRVSQYVAEERGSGPLRKRLHEVFNKDYPLTEVHRFLARLTKSLPLLRHSSSSLLLLTTNYDDVLERAFNTEGVEYDLVTYVNEGPERGRFRHRSPDGKVTLVSSATDYIAVDPEKRCVILKIHGAVDRSSESSGDYVITEDDYIDYLTRTDLTRFIPVKVLAKLRCSGFLFLAYSLQDWNLRAILRSIRGDSDPRSWKSWAIQFNPNPLEQRFWKARGVDIYDIDLRVYIAGLNRYIEEELAANAKARADTTNA